MALIVPSSVVVGTSCAAPFAASAPGSITSTISADTLTVASGTELPLRVSLTNDGDSTLSDGSVIIVISRESKAGDFTADRPFIVTRSVVKKGVSIAPHSTLKLGFAWRLPSSLPGGIYRADAIFSQGGQILRNVLVPGTEGPFNGGAKFLVSGEATGTAFFVASLVGDSKPSITLVNATGQDIILPVAIKTYAGGVGSVLIGSESKVVSLASGSSTVIPYSAPASVTPYAVTAETTYRDTPAFYMYATEGSSAKCPDQSELYSWAMLIGGLGTIMLVLAHLKERYNRA